MANRRLPIISVSDVYEISSDKTAKCTRTYSFYNSGTTPLDIVAHIYEDKFDVRTESHKIEDAPEGKRNLDCKVDGYNKICFWKPSKIEVPPKESHVVQISWVWPNFLVTTDEKSSLTISYYQQRKLTYSLHIIPPKKEFFENFIHDGKPESPILRLDDGSLSFGPVKMEDCSFRFNFKLIINPPFDSNRILPLLHRFGSSAPKNMFKDYLVLMVQHLLGDFIPFVNTLTHCGMNMDDCYIIGIPYSTKSYVVENLKKVMKEKNLIAPKEYPFLDDVKKLLQVVIERCRKENKKFLVIEDGGYIVPLLHSAKFQKGLKYCLGAVEQTANGIWEDRRLYEDNQLKIPVMNVADSELKKNLESRLIGIAIVSNIERLLSKGFQDGVFGRNCLVIGLGAVGQNIVSRLIADGAIVYGYDKDKSVMEKVIGDIIKLRKVIKVSDSISEQTIVIGATGKTHIGFTEIAKAQNNTIFINATSKRKEIDIEQLEGLTDKKEKMEGIGTIYRLNIGKSIILFADGYPINFYDSESVPDQEIQFVSTLLFEATRLMIERGYKKPRIVNIPKNIQTEIKKTYNILRQTPINIKRK